MYYKHIFYTITDAFYIIYFKSYYKVTTIHYILYITHILYTVLKLLFYRHTYAYTFAHKDANNCLWETNVHLSKSTPELQSPPHSQNQVIQSESHLVIKVGNCVCFLAFPYSSQWNLFSKLIEYQVNTFNEPFQWYDFHLLSWLYRWERLWGRKISWFHHLNKNGLPTRPGRKTQ